MNPCADPDCVFAKPHQEHLPADVPKRLDAPAPAAPVEGPRGGLSSPAATGMETRPRRALCTSLDCTEKQMHWTDDSRCTAPAASLVREPPPAVSPSGKPVWFPPEPEDCPGCAKVKRHPGEDYVCARHPRAAPAAPVREPGALTFAEALKGLERGEKWRRKAWPAARWTGRKGDAPLAVWRPTDGGVDHWTCEVDFADMLATDWEPLPPPAPNPGRVAELVEKEFDLGGGARRVLVDQVTVTRISTAVAREALACVRRHVLPESIENVLDAAAVELLGEGEVKRGG